MKRVYLVVVLLLVVNIGTRGIVEEENDLQKQYQLLEQSSIKTIKTANGVIYDCVDFYKQPAFKHPMLKNHTLYPQMRTKYTHRTIKAMSSNDEAIQCQVLMLENGGCPTGTVPIRRVSMDDLVQIKTATKNYDMRTTSNSLLTQPGQQFAIVQTNFVSRTTKYYGVRGIFNYYQLPRVRAPQYSSGEIIIRNGDDMIKVGWTVNPALNKDNIAHMFQYLSAGQSHCFNTLCPGFVSTNKDVSIDAGLVGSSKRGGLQRVISLFIYQDAKTKNWWLEICGIVLGYWPQQIFTKMADGATYVAVGGEAFNLPGQPLPPMGNGYYPSEELGITAFWHNFTVLDSNHQHIIPQQTEKYTTDWHYGVYDMMHGKEGRAICYGGTTM
ncbi:uncharacterized protein [Spinacia oleracea]|uniref:Neprosin PEP catalytic domain-containing protein n=1 Tax=Spinacia oleracea TaxID=3562 RepID=A0ABM3REI1_SPIOL|nr:uncharacterized protein LOC130468989 [Spinacia oleracea]